MSPRPIVFIILVVLTILSIQPVSVMGQGVLYVGSAAACGVPSPYPTVSDAIANAADGDTIVLCEDIVESTPYLLINKSVVITGDFGGNIHKWTVLDTNSSDPLIEIRRNVQFKDIVIEMNTTGSVDSTGDYILVVSSTLTVNNTIINGTMYGAASTRLIHIGQTSTLMVNNSKLYLTRSSGNPEGVVVRVFEGYLYMDKSTVYIDSSTSPISAILFIYYTGGTSFGNFIRNSNVTSMGIGVYIYLTYRSFSLSISNTVITSTYRAIYADVRTWAGLSLDISGSTIQSMSDRGVHVRGVNAGGISVNINPSTIIGYSNGLSVSGSYGTPVSFSIVDSTIKSHTSYALTATTWGSTSIFGTILRSVIEGLWGMLLDSTGSSYVEVYIGSSIVNSTDTTADSMGIAIESTYTSVAVLSVEYSYILSNYVGIGVQTFSLSSVELYLYYAYLGWPGVDALLMDIDDFFYMVASYSVVGIVTVSGDGYPEVYLYESAYDELNSFTNGFPFYSEWTLKVKVISKTTGQPVQGALVTAFYDNTPIASATTDIDGEAYLLLSYDYEETDPFINHLRIMVTYKGSTVLMPYTDFEPAYTIPSWLGYMEIEIEATVLMAYVFGSNGAGILSIAGKNGQLMLGSFGISGWINTYPIQVISVSGIGPITVINAYLLYDGVWIPGKITINKLNKQVYMRFGTLEYMGYIP